MHKKDDFSLSQKYDKGNIVKETRRDPSAERLAMPLDVDGVQDIQTKVRETETRKWLPTEEAATYLGITPTALRIRVHRGQVKFYKLGSRLRFRIKDLEGLLQKKETFQ